MVCGRLLDQRDDVAHAEDAVGDALGMKILQRIHFFAGADQFYRLAGDGAHGQRRAAASVAVDAGQHDAGNADAVVEALGEIDRVLAGQGCRRRAGFHAGCAAALISAISAISGSSIWVRPAVSSSTTS